MRSGDILQSGRVYTLHFSVNGIGILTPGDVKDALVNFSSISEVDVQRSVSSSTHDYYDVSFRYLGSPASVSDVGNAMAALIHDYGTFTMFETVSLITEGDVGGSGSGAAAEEGNTNVNYSKYALIVGAVGLGLLFVISLGFGLGVGIR